MQIGIDARLPYYRMGGISQYVLHLLAALAEVDKANEYLVFQSRKDGRSYRPEQGNFQRVDAWTPCHHRWERWLLGAEVQVRRPDLFHSPDFIPPGFGARRRVITVHDLNFLYYPEYLTPESRGYYRGQIGWAVREADRIAADSEHTRQDLIERLGVAPEKVRRIYLAANPIYHQTPPPAAVAETLAAYSLPRGFLLFVGTLEPRKNVPVLLEAYALLREEAQVGLPLVLVGGKGWLYEEIFEKIEGLGLSGSVRHLSGVSDQMLAHLYHAAGVLALPSHYEGFGLPPLEAMHCGCPVVVSERGSLPEIVGEAGIVLPPDDVPAWAEALARLISDSEHRERMISRGRVQAARFTWEETAAETLALYREAAEV
ncbi:MAG: glycosyltransferase family 1 protein [Anaerolineae bacterium]|nr:glycosyltransferase family 1 protein [Anaerolineae bacterium]